MASRGVIFKSCFCIADGQVGRRRNRACPLLTPISGREFVEHWHAARRALDPSSSAQ
jgi:hypothetical protein